MCVYVYINLGVIHRKNILDLYVMVSPRWQEKKFSENGPIANVSTYPYLFIHNMCQYTCIIDRIAI